MACSTGSSAESSDTDSDPEVDPTTITDDYWVCVEGPDEISSSQKTLGKWLVFKRFERLDETWHMIRKAVESGELGATGAKCSTAKDNPLKYPRNSNKGVICVYTSEETMDEVGFKLIRMVKQDIRYKTDEATLKGEYIVTGYKKVTVKTIFWNNGEPGFTKTFTRRRHGEANRYPNALAPRVDPSRLPTKPPYIVYLGNLSFECTVGDVLEFFERKNINVLSVRLPLESRTNRPRGFGYTELENIQALMEALSLSGEALRGRPVKVDVANAVKTGHHHRDPYDDRGPPRRYDEGHHYRDPYGDHGPPRRYDEGHHYRDPYGDHGPPRRYDEGHHHRDPYGDRGPPRRYDEGHHYRDPYGDHGPPRRYDEGLHHRDPYDDRGPPRRYDEGHHHDSYDDRGPPRRYDEGHHYRDPYGSDGYHLQQRSLEGHREWDRRRDELSKERPRLQLQPHTKPPEDTLGWRERGGGGGGGGGGGVRASSSIFGQAKPVDTAARDREIEERLLRERAETEERGDRSLTDEGGKRGGRRNESRQRERTDRRGRYDSGGRGERGERGHRSERGERGGRGHRSERGERRGRHDSGGQRERGERSDSSDRGERRDGKRPPRDDCHDTTETTGWGGRRRESYEEEEERASEPGRGRGNDDPASPTKK